MRRGSSFSTSTEQAIADNAHQREYGVPMFQHHQPAARSHSSNVVPTGNYNYQTSYETSYPTNYQSNYQTNYQPNYQDFVQQQPYVQQPQYVQQQAYVQPQPYVQEQPPPLPQSQPPVVPLRSRFLQQKLATIDCSAAPRYVPPLTR